MDEQLSFSSLKWNPNFLYLFSPLHSPGHSIPSVSSFQHKSLFLFIYFFIPLLFSLPSPPIQTPAAFGESGKINWFSLMVFPVSGSGELWAAAALEFGRVELKIGHSLGYCTWRLAPCLRCFRKRKLIKNKKIKIQRNCNIRVDVKERRTKIILICLEK